MTDPLKNRLTEQLNALQTTISDYIRIKCIYRDIVNKNTHKLDLIFKIKNKSYKRSVPLGDLVQDLSETIIKPFLDLQQDTIVWEYISITYPRSKTNKNIANIPMRGINGKILTDAESARSNSGTIGFNMRYEGSVGISKIKLSGIGNYYLDPESYNEQACIDILSRCENIFQNTIDLNQSQLLLDFVQEKKMVRTKRDTKNKKIKTIDKKYKKPILVTGMPE